MTIIKWIWLVVFAAGAGYYLIFGMFTGALSVADGQLSGITALIEFLISLVCLNIGLTGYVLFDRKATSRA